MRVALLIVLPVALLGNARAQSPAQPQPSPDLPPGVGQEITIDDLQGAIINFAILQTGRTRWSGEPHIIHPVQINTRFKIEIGPGSYIRWSVGAESRVLNKKYP